MDERLGQAFRRVRTANWIFVIATAIVLLAANIGSGEFVNPHAGGPGLMLAMLAFVVALAILVVALPVAIPGLVRNPTERSSGKVFGVVFGSLIAIYVGFTVIAIVIQML